MGVPLFHSSKRAISLTDDGATFLPSALRILSEIKNAERQGKLTKVFRTATPPPADKFVV
ncbi:MAG: hypothetical protein COA41_15430 [Sphingopyxis sp.]|nr:MAG: hypothetical protein COA41_15430 [Sphingopyxis sp.]